MKRVLMVADNGLGQAGVPMVMMSILRGLRSQFQFDLVLFTKEVRHYDAEVLSYGCKIFRVPSYEGKNLFLKRINYYLRGELLYRSIRRIIKENGPYDVVHCHKIYEGAVCLKAATEFGIPVRIIHAHTNPQGDHMRKLRVWCNDLYLRLINQFATHKVACSITAGESAFGKNKGVIAIYNAYDENRFDPDKYPRTEKPLELIQIGSYSENKNQLFSLEVLSALRNQGEDAKLHFVGFGDYRKKVEERAAWLGLTEFVHFHEANADTPQLLSQSAACLFPSKREGFGIVQVEAQAMGVRCYVSDTVPKDADAGGCCFLSLDDGADKWAEKILADYQHTKGMPEKFDCSAFTTAKVVETYRRLYCGNNI